MDNRKINTKLAIAIIVIFAITLGVLVWIYENEQRTIGETQAPITEKQNQVNNTTNDKSSNIEWKTYKNKLLGLEFNYPADWGDVIVENGNINNVNIPPCKDPLMMSYSQKQYPWGLYNTALKFSNIPIDFEIRLVKLDAPNNPKEVCNGRGDIIKISTIQPKIQDDKEILIINKADIEFISNPILFNSINTSLEGPTYATRHDNKLVWIYSGFTPYYGTPEEIELRKYTNFPECQGGNAYNADKGCGIVAWAQTGKTSEKIRESFDNIKELVQSFTLN